MNHLFDISRVWHCRVPSVLALALGLLIPSTCLGGMAGDKELFLLVAAGFKANMENVRSWKGQATVEMQTAGDPGGSGTRRKASADFVYDRDTEAVRWAWRQTEGVRDGKAETPYVARGMLHRNRIYRLSLMRLDEPPAAALLRIDPRPEGPVPVAAWGDEFHPMAHFKQIGHDTPRIMEWYYENADNPKIIGGSIKKEGTLITVEVGDHAVVNRYVFDTAQGCNLVSYYAKDSAVEESHSFSYAAVDGVFLPASATHKNVNTSGNAPRTMTVNVEFDKNVVNASVGAEEFTLEKLGVRPGDRIVDTVANINYLYKQEVASVDRLTEPGSPAVAATRPAAVAAGGPAQVAQHVTGGAGAPKPSAGMGVASAWLWVGAVALVSLAIMSVARVASARRSRSLSEGGSQ